VQAKTLGKQRWRLCSGGDFAKINCSALVAKALAQADKVAIVKAQAATDKAAIWS
jgi:hypothetical protein